ncbi:MAG: prolyl oligopeptidase family serine peptidase [Tannerella sp.]|jgi:dipeptidyl aminopeptidase/acylaminoacyl peptidase|nr:prolyl oligopeptidase family serine peptidase [Tannerella sp.]
MKRISIIILSLSVLATGGYAQKKPLDHSVYDSWESVTQTAISNDGRFAAYIVAPQDGDSALYVTDLKTSATTRIDRGFNHRITDDSRYLVFGIKPSQAEKKDARKNKKKAEEQPKDSLGWLKLGTQNVEKIADVGRYKIAEKASAFFAYLTSMPKDTVKHKKDEKLNCLIIYFFDSGKSDTVDYVSDFTVSKNGKFVAYTTKLPEKDTVSAPGIYLYDTKSLKSAALLEGKGDYKLQSFDEDATRFVFYATTDTSKRDPKVYNLYLTKTDAPSAGIIADTLSAQMPENWAVSASANAFFSRDGSKLYFGIAPIIAPKDTTIDESEVASLDIWNYQDDYLQPTQLKRLTSELNRSYQCVFNTGDFGRFIPLGSPDLESIALSEHGNGEFALGTTTNTYRIESQWTGFARNDVYIVSTLTGERTLVAKGLASRPSISPADKYLYWFDRETSQWYIYSIADKAIRCVTENIDTHFEDPSGERPEKPDPFGQAGWDKDDCHFYVYDKFDIWQIDPTGKTSPSMITKGLGRKENIVFRNVRLDFENDFIDTGKPLLLSAFNKITKESGYYTLEKTGKSAPQKRIIDKKTFGQITKAKNVNVFAYTKADFGTTPDLWTTQDLWKHESQISRINRQMNDYLWGSAELVSWKSKDNYDLQGILYKPENFDPTKKYPMIIYFYERHSDDLYKHFVPAPSRSTVNIPFFCSRGYLVFTPDIHYVDGHPGRSAYNSIVAGAEMLCRNPWVDKDHIGIQGQSWGGYQVAFLVTQTDMFAAAGAGAPVSNMTSAYGGIRWESGLNRQMQYERQQSRIGKTLWDGLDLYIENSPLFFADKVKTPLLIMHNDNDGAVPWYQGIEYFTALKRLGKVVYMLQYNGEQHNLVQRRNSRDLSVRLQQFFDHYLKGAPMPVWMKSGVPATKKGRTWGLEIEE